jgi:hypothetical protein
MQLEILSSNNEEEFRESLQELIKKYNIDLGVKVTDLSKLREQHGTKRLCIVVDGPTLTYVMKDPFTSNAFF